MALLFLPHTLDASVSKLPDVGPAFEKRLGKLGIATIRDLLLTLPFGWETYGGPSAIAALTPGVQATVVGRVVKIFIKTTTRKKMRLTEAMIEDDSGERLRVAWFNNPYVVKNLNQGDRVAIAGMVKAGYGGVPEMQSPHYERLDGDPDAQPSRVGGLMPKYHLVNGLTNRKVAQWVESALPLAGQVEDVLPDEVRARHKLMDVGDAIRLGHKPETDEDFRGAKKRMAFAELFELQAAFAMMRAQMAAEPATPIPYQQAVIDAFKVGLGFELTRAQKKATWDAFQDMARPVPMNRLLNGDVGSGKTAVAAACVAMAHASGLQSVVMAPTGTLALALYGEMTTSVIDEMPPGRTPVQTEVVAPDDRQHAYSLVRAEVAAGHQAFVICPLIDDSEAVVARSATAEFERLKKDIFPDLRLDLIHGRLKDKEQVMQRFVGGEIQVLVATAVVEVGVDVPNATVMMIEGADRFGLALLHPCRGRVGRGTAPSRCLVLTDDTSEKSIGRLELLTRVSDGFKLAQEDMNIRGMGELMGPRQHGMSDTAMEALLQPELLSEVRQEAERILESDPGFAHHALLKSTVARRLEMTSIS